MLVVGGITRLTQSGLSMVDWQPIMGTLPPMNSADWQEAFQQYQQYPEYQQLNPDMTLAEFKTIFFWEYVHRLLGRLTGLVFLIPFLWFWFTGRFDARLKRRALLLFLLGGAQGGMGWLMVKSGLVDVPYVSHYRLALHLALTFVLFGLCIWYALDLYKPKITWVRSQKIYRALRRWLVVIGMLIFLQVIWGSFVAGLKAGYMFNTFPLMQGNWIPEQLHNMQPHLLNYLENPVTVQWTHRVLGTLLGLTVILFWIRMLIWNIDRDAKFKAVMLLAVVLIQYVLGVITLFYSVPVTLGVLHQAIALILCGVWINLFHYQVRELRPLSS